MVARRSGRRSIVDVTPSAARLTQSLRDIGYDFTAAVADLVDNSIAASARRVDIEVNFDGPLSYVVIADDGHGMTEPTLHEALRFGSRRRYEAHDLGRFGLGLKTASISQCRRVTVISRHAPTVRRIVAKTLDIDWIARRDRWEIIDPPVDSCAHVALNWLSQGPGTVVLWEHMDRTLPSDRADGGWAKRRLKQLAERTSAYLGMVFHRFLDGQAWPSERLVITVNGEKVRPWNPFAPGEGERDVLSEKLFELATAHAHGQVRLASFVLPPRNRFSSAGEFERLSGPLKWNRQQGLYIYREDRMIQSGGWCGLRSADEHTKLARAALDFGTELDGLFQVNVAKMRVALPTELRGLLQQPVAELTHSAGSAYRRAGGIRRLEQSPSESVPTRPRGALTSEAGVALRAAAMETGDSKALARVMKKVKARNPEVAQVLGW